MLVSEKQAVDKLCPVTLTVTALTTPSINDGHCVGSRCMAWQWAVYTETTKLGCCGLAMQWRKRRPSMGDEAEGT